MGWRARALVPTTEDDGTLVERIRRGDEQAFAALYRRHARYVAGVAYRLLGRDAEIDDVVQETFVDAANGIRRLKEPGSVRTWLVTIAVRRVMRRLASRRRLEWLGLELGRLGRGASEPRDRERIDALRDVLERVPPRLRVPWVLHRIEGEPLSEVARLCRVSLATVKRRIGRAEERIRRRLHAE